MCRAVSQGDLDFFEDPVSRCVGHGLLGSARLEGGSWNSSSAQPSKGREICSHSAEEMVPTSGNFRRSQSVSGMSCSGLGACRKLREGEGGWEAPRHSLPPHTEQSDSHILLWLGQSKQGLSPGWGCEITPRKCIGKAAGGSPGSPSARSLWKDRRRQGWNGGSCEESLRGVLWHGLHMQFALVPVPLCCLSSIPKLAFSEATSIL